MKNAWIKHAAAKLLYGAALFTFAVGMPHLASAEIAFNPVDDGSLYICQSCNPEPNRGYVLVSGYIVGDIVFSTPTASETPAPVLLLVNPYGLPLYGPTLDVYGKANATGVISQSDVLGATFIGTWTLPSLTYGQATFFNVTEFASSVQTSYIDFTLHSGGTDVFSSTRYNYGLPPQLLVVPEPTTLSLRGVALVGIWATRQQKR